MLLNRTCFRLALGMLVLLIGLPASAQNLREMKLFAPADVSTYGGAQQPNEGYFFSFDGLHWYISAPKVASIGANIPRTVYYGPDAADMVIQTDTFDTGELSVRPTEGSRIEFGRICDRLGWLVSTYNLRSQNQDVIASDVVMTFVDPPNPTTGTKLLEGVVGTDPQAVSVIRDLPLSFRDVVIRNHVDTWSAELMAVHRFKQRHRGGFFEVLAGVRYMEFDESFNVEAFGLEPPATPTESILADSTWDTVAQNHIVGPQLGARWFRTAGRWTLITEGRFLAGLNWQNMRQRGILGTKLPALGVAVPDFSPLLMKTTSFEHAMHTEEWTPVAEFRVDARYQITRSIAVRVGWTGMWMDGIARPSNMINYEVPSMGMLPEFNCQDVFVHGCNVGIDINR